MLVPFILAASLALSPAAEVRTSRPQKAPARQDRNMAVALELGWNSLAGVGLSYTYYARPQLALEAGAGLGIGGKAMRVGARARYNLLPFNLSPFVAVGVTVVPGGSLTLTQDNDDRSVALALHTTPAVQGTAGLSWQSNGGFVAQLSGGYSYNLATPYTAHAQLSARDRQTANTLLGHGPSASLALGHAF